MGNTKQVGRRKNNLGVWLSLFFERLPFQGWFEGKLKGMASFRLGSRGSPKARHPYRTLLGGAKQVRAHRSSIQVGVFFLSASRFGGLNGKPKRKPQLLWV